MQDYRKLAVWERSHKFTLQIYQLTSGFPKTEVFGITSQLDGLQLQYRPTLQRGVVEIHQLTLQVF